MRRVQIIEGMFLDICSPAEKQKVDRYYQNRQKGLAIIFMLNKIRDHWVTLINKEYKEKAQAKNPRLVKVNRNGVPCYRAFYLN